MKAVKNILLSIAAVLLGLVAAVGILSVPETNDMCDFLIITIASKVIGAAALYCTFLLVSYIYKENGISTPRL